MGTGNTIWKPITTITFALVAVAAAAVLGYLLVSSNESEDNSPLRSVIIDQLSLTQPNPEFVTNATVLLEGAGYKVDIYSGREVTVDLFRTLPELDYNLVVLRAHSAVASVRGDETDLVSVFTGEPYEATEHPEDQATNRVGVARADADDEELFAITPDFVRESMSGQFDGATVILMGCDGLASPQAAEAFLDIGASAFVSWTKPVSAPHTDAATERLIELLAADGEPLNEAVSATADEVGADPYYGGELRLVTR